MANKTKNRLREKYSQVDNSIPRNYNLSFQAIGFYTLLNSLPDGWEFTYAGIMAIRRDGNDPESKPKEGEKVLQKLVKELTLEGALVRVRASFHNDTVGGYGGFDWIINPDAEDIELARLEDPILTRLTEEIEIKGVKVGGGISKYNKKTITENPQPPKQPTEQKEKKTKYPKKEQEFRDMLERVQQKVKRKTKANFTKKALELFKQSGLSADEVERNFILHINQVGQFSKTIANFLLEYEVCVEDLSNSNTSSSQNQQNKPETHIEMRERELAEKIARLQNQDNTNKDIFETEIIGV